MEFMTAFGSVRPPYPPNTRGIRNDVVAAPEAIKGATMPLDSRDFDDARTSEVLMLELIALTVKTCEFQSSTFCPQRSL
jgi:hypothetical protein